MEAMAQKSGDASGHLTSLQCFNSKDMIKPDYYDMEPGTFHNWNELFVSNMMSIDRKWGLILTTLQRKDAAVKKEDISCVQDELKDAAVEKGRHLLTITALYCEMLSGVHDKAKQKGRVISNSIELYFEMYRKLYQKGKNAAKMNIVLKKAEVLRPRNVDTVDEIGNSIELIRSRRTGKSGPEVGKNAATQR